MEKTLSIGSLLMESSFQSTLNKVLIPLAEWLPGVQVKHSATPLVKYVQRIVGCLVILTQWQSTSSFKPVQFLAASGLFTLSNFTS